MSGTHHCYLKVTPFPKQAQTDLLNKYNVNFSSIGHWLSFLKKCIQFLYSAGRTKLRLANSTIFGCTKKAGTNLSICRIYCPCWVHGKWISVKYPESKEIMSKDWQVRVEFLLCEMCPNTEFFLVRVFPHSDWILRDAKYLSVFSSNAGKYGPEKTPYLGIFHAVFYVTIELSRPRW